MGAKIPIPQDVAEEGKQHLVERGYEIKMGSGITVDATKGDVVDWAAILTGAWDGDLSRIRNVT